MISYRKFVEWLNRPLYQLHLYIREKAQERSLLRPPEMDRSNLYRFPKLKGKHTQAAPGSDQAEVGDAPVIQAPIAGSTTKSQANQRHSFKRAR
jgi:hypothetical protein